MNWGHEPKNIDCRYTYIHPSTVSYFLEKASAAILSRTFLFNFFFKKSLCRTFVFKKSQTTLTPHTNTPNTLLQSCQSH